MRGDELVSVVVPSYNMSAYLPFAVDSVLAQTYPHVEVHVVDDGSEDDTARVIERYADDPRVHYHYRSNGGMSAARNTGIRAARGTIIGLCDADDMWEPDKLEIQLPCFSGAPSVGVVYTDAQWMDERGERLPTRAWGAQHRVSGRILNELFMHNVVTGSTSLIRRECFDSVGFYDETLTSAEDYELWLRIATAYEFVYLDRVTYLYRQWGGQTSRDGRRMIDNIEAILRRFQGRYGPQLDPTAVSGAWANLFTARASNALEQGHPRWPAFQDVGRALRNRPGHIPAWKTGIKLLINRHELQR